MKGWEHEEDKDKHEDELDRKNALKLPFVNSSTCPNCYDEGLGGDGEVWYERYEPLCYGVFMRFV